MKFIKSWLIAFCMVVASASAFGQALQPKQDGKGKFGYVDNSGKWIVKPKYTAAKDFVIFGNYAYAIIEIDGKKGLIDSNGKELIKPKHQNVYSAPNENGYIFLEDKYKQKEGSWSSATFFACSDAQKANLSDVSINKSSWYYDFCFSFYDKKYKSITITLNKPTEINDTVVSKLIFDDVEKLNSTWADYNKNRWSVYQDNNVIVVKAPLFKSNIDGYVFKDGELIAFGDGYVFNGGELIAFGDIERSFLTDYFLKKNKLIEDYYISIKGDIFKNVKANIFFNPDNGRYGILSNDKIAFKYDCIDAFASENIAYLVKLDEVWKLLIYNYSVSKDDDPLSSYELAYTFKNPSTKIPTVSDPNKNYHFIIEDGGKYGLICNYYGTSKILIDFKCDSINAYKVNNAPYYEAYTKGKCELYGYSGNFKQLAEYNANLYEFYDIYAFSKAVVLKSKQSGKYGLFYNGKMVIPATYDSYKAFTDETFLVKKGKIWYLFDIESGKVIVDGTRYDAAREMRTHMLKVWKNGKVGIYGAGRVIAPAIYDDCIFSGNGFYIMGSESGGNMIICAVYDSKGVLRTKQTITSPRALASMTSKWCGAGFLDEGERYLIDAGYKMVKLK